MGLLGEAEISGLIARCPTVRDLTKSTGTKDLLVPVRVRTCDPRGLLSQVVYIDLVGLAEVS